jgi:hypothetical protein
MSWERELIAHWIEFSQGEYQAGFIGINSQTASAFAEWLGAGLTRSNLSADGPK